MTLKVYAAGALVFSGDVVDVLSAPGSVAVYTADGSVVIDGVDLDGKDFRTILAEERALEALP